jgi:hypothetical protein
MKKKVTLAYPYSELRRDGKVKKHHDADTTVELDRAEANRLLHEGLARVPDDADEPSGSEDNPDAGSGADDTNGA